MPDVFLYPAEINPRDIRLRNPTVAGGGATVSPAGTPSAEAVGSPSLAQVVAPSAIIPAESSGATTVASVVLLSGIGPAEISGAHAAGFVVSPSGVPSIEILGAALVEHSLALSGIGSAEQVSPVTVGTAGAVVYVSDVEARTFIGSVRARPRVIDDGSAFYKRPVQERRDARVEVSGLARTAVGTVYAAGSATIAPDGVAAKAHVGPVSAEGVDTFAEEEDLLLLLLAISDGED